MEETNFRNTLQKPMNLALKLRILFAGKSNKAGLKEKKTKYLLKYICQNELRGEHLKVSGLCSALIPGYMDQYNHTQLRSWHAKITVERIRLERTNKEFCFQEDQLRLEVPGKFLVNRRKSQVKLPDLEELLCTFFYRDRQCFQGESVWKEFHSQHKSPVSASLLAFQLLFYLVTPHPTPPNVCPQPVLPITAQLVWLLSFTQLFKQPICLFSKICQLWDRCRV